ncbi:DUF2807 domain-containing protein [Rugamonas sp.]|uniref:GIN domain-containing protein n=1 Tax=Rugamonas sp. TaxID=1926287 RepID=UPI002600F886|nr:DUF2807 domain-containing protein [Rugamonas sp.]
MKKLLQFGLLLTAFFTLFGRAQADETSTETQVIDARVVRVKIDGMLDLKVRQGAVPSLTITADKTVLAKLTAVQSGDTLHFDTESHGFKFSRSSGARAVLVLPALREVVSDGVGSTEINGFSGEQIDLTLEGAGSMKMTCDYKKLKANLGGVGSMTLWVSENDSVDLDLRGAGYITIGGHSKMLNATLGGLGSLNAQQLQADSATVELSGLGNATVSAKTNATLNLSGLGSVTVYGKPLNRNVSVDGLGKVTWK